MATVARKGLVCEHCGKFLDFSYGLEDAVAVVCLYCRSTIEANDDLLVTLGQGPSDYRWPVPKPSTDPAHISAELILLERGYTKEEARVGLGYFQQGLRCDRATIKRLTKRAEDFIEICRDDMRVGTDLYRGTGCFWAYKYRFWMRGDAHGNGYKGIPVKQARQKIHKRFLDEGLSLWGETQRHDEIIDEVFGTSGYGATKSNREGGN